MIDISEFIVIIPARGGSKRIKNKNLKALDGRHMIEYTIEYALKNFRKENIWINSDSENILQVGRSFGINLYKRKQELATDITLTSDVIYDQVINIMGMKKFKFVVILQPTSPFRPKNLIKVAINKIHSKNLDSLFSVSTLDRKFGEIINEQFIPNNYKFGQRSQDLKKFFFENGLLYITSLSLILKKTVLNKKSYPLIDDSLESLIDIDTEKDFKMAELYLKLWK